MNTPIAIKDFGMDSVSGMNKQLIVYGLNINTDTQTIEVNYKIVLVSPTGLQFEQSRYSYIRDNNTPVMHFDTLQASQIGIGIKSVISNDLNLIQSYESLSKDLKES